MRNNSQQTTSKNQPLVESSSNEEDEIFLKAFHEETDYEVTKLSYKQLFKLSTNLIE